MAMSSGIAANFFMSPIRSRVPQTISTYADERCHVLRPGNADGDGIIEAEDPMRKSSQDETNRTSQLLVAREEFKKTDHADGYRQVRTTLSLSER